MKQAILINTLLLSVSVFGQNARANILKGYYDAKVVDLQVRSEQPAPKSIYLDMTLDSSVPCDSGVLIVKVGSRLAKTSVGCDRPTPLGNPTTKLVVTWDTAEWKNLLQTQVHFYTTRFPPELWYQSLPLTITSDAVKTTVGNNVLIKVSGGVYTHVASITPANYAKISGYSETTTGTQFTFVPVAAYPTGVTIVFTDLSNPPRSVSITIPINQ